MSRQEINDTRLAHSRLSGECQLKIQQQLYTAVSAMSPLALAATFAEEISRLGQSEVWQHGSAALSLPRAGLWEQLRELGTIAARFSL